jgi:5'-nucleotidase
MNPGRPHLLLTNDDGYDAEGIRELSKVLRGYGKVTLIGPDRECSGISHGFSLNHPLRLKRKGEGVYSLSGTPADCVMFGLRGFLEPADLPDFVFSGINHGANLGWDVIYSGTVAGALEGTLFDKPAVAVSLATEFSGRFESGLLQFETVVAFLEEFVPVLLARGIPNGVFLNINVPNIPKEDLRGYAFTRLGKRIYRDRVVKRTDPHGREYYWLGGEPPTYESEDGTDFHALEQSMVSITPLRWKMSHPEDLDLFSDWPQVAPEAAVEPEV